MQTDPISRLTNTLRLTDRSSSQKRSASLSISARERQKSRRNYEQFTNCTKDEQKRLVKFDQTMRRANWKHDYYRANNTFSVFEKKQLEHFPHYNDKYNVQFLERSLYGKNYCSPASKIGFFKKPEDQLYSKHYQPIVKNKRSFNEDYELRTSMFGETWVDTKRDRIVDEYKLQANPFRTPLSNALISTMRQDRRHFHKL